MNTAPTQHAGTHVPATCARPHRADAEAAPQETASAASADMGRGRGACAPS